ncbi:hypothetical protein AAMO2058_000423000 [Amorphochlora amoebiformis]
MEATAPLDIDDDLFDDSEEEKTASEKKAAELIVAGPTGVVKLRPGLYTVGKDARCDVVINCPSVSNKHALLEINEDRKHFITDLGSLNGTWMGTLINFKKNQRVRKKRTAIPDGSINLFFGNVLGKFRAISGENLGALSPIQPLLDRTQSFEEGNTTSTANITQSFEEVKPGATLPSSKRPNSSVLPGTKGLESPAKSPKAVCSQDPTQSLEDIPETIPLDPEKEEEDIPETIPLDPEEKEDDIPETIPLDPEEKGSDNIEMKETMPLEPDTKKGGDMDPSEIAETVELDAQENDASKSADVVAKEEEDEIEETVPLEVKEEGEDEIKETVPLEGAGDETIAYNDEGFPHKKDPAATIAYNDDDDSPTGSKDPAATIVYEDDDPPKKDKDPAATIAYSHDDHDDPVEEDKQAVDATIAYDNDNEDNAGDKEEVDATVPYNAVADSMSAATQLLDPIPEENDAPSIAFHPRSSRGESRRKAGKLEKKKSAVVGKSMSSRRVKGSRIRKRVRSGSGLSINDISPKKSQDTQDSTITEATEGSSSIEKHKSLAEGPPKVLCEAKGSRIGVWVAGDTKKWETNLKALGMRYKDSHMAFYAEVSKTLRNSLLRRIKVTLATEPEPPKSKRKVKTEEEKKALREAKEAKKKAKTAPDKKNKSRTKKRKRTIEEDEEEEEDDVILEEEEEMQIEKEEEDEEDDEKNAMEQEDEIPSKPVRKSTRKRRKRFVVLSLDLSQAGEEAECIDEEEQNLEPPKKTSSKVPTPPLKSKSISKPKPKSKSKRAKKSEAKCTLPKKPETVSIPAKKSEKEPKSKRKTRSKKEIDNKTSVGGSGKKGKISEDAIDDDDEALIEEEEKQDKLVPIALPTTKKKKKEEIVRWYWKSDLDLDDDDVDAWTSYPEEDLELIEEKYQEGARKLNLNKKYSINLVEMFQYQTRQTHRQRSIKRYPEAKIIAKSEEDLKKEKKEKKKKKNTGAAKASKKAAGRKKRKVKNSPDDDSQAPKEKRVTRSSRRSARKKSRKY